MGAGAWYSGSEEYLAALEQGVPTPASPSVPQPEVMLGACADAEHDRRQRAVLQLINAYRFHGFRSARLDPLALHPAPYLPELDPAQHQLDADDRTQLYDTGSLVGPERDSLANILARLRAAYCGSLGAEYMHCNDTAKKRWLQQRLEEPEGACDPARQRWLLEQLTRAEQLEKMIHARFTGQKRFSLEGGEALIPLLNLLAEHAARRGVTEIGLGMAHRGRLNVLHNVLGRSAFGYFNGAAASPEGVVSGDVKYHQGYARTVETQAGPIRIALAFNPSHLEFVSPVVLGWVRAQQRKWADKNGRAILPVLIHGDAAFSGQGVVMETLNMSATRGYSVGGSIHVVINNQIGFTTSDPRDTRSSLYCTDVMKLIDAPVLHVNGDDPEAVARAAHIALDYRQAFGSDIAIDLVCFRRLGHNEQDEPMVTQPLMYGRIHSHPGVRARFAERLLAEGCLGAAEAELMIETVRADLDATEHNPSRDYSPHVADWRRFRGQDWRTPTPTALPGAVLRDLGERLCQVPEGFTLHPRVTMVVEARRQMVAGEMGVDYGMAEALAFASLLTEGRHIRITGQDCGRGTFFHRHAVWHDQHRKAREAGVWLPLQHLSDTAGHFLVINSLLSETAVLGFEFGYASSSPEDLVIWEAQFGDFANGAQVIIDQFITSAEAKWGRLNGLTLLLPHGYEGQGPEHSSARIERWLQLCADDNIQVTQPSTAAQFFHLLRRQVLRPYRKPLVVFTPKSLLRSPAAASPLAELENGGFQAVLTEAGGAGIRRVILTSGRLYYDLIEARQQGQRDDIAILRVEQFYPLPDVELRAALAAFPQAESWVWAQDEPANQGAWRYMRREFVDAGLPKLAYAGRPASASPATGSHAMHEAQRKALIAEALGETSA